MTDPSDGPTRVPFVQLAMDRDRLRACIATALTGQRPIDESPNYDYWAYVEGSVTEWCGTIRCRLSVVRCDGHVMRAWCGDYDSGIGTLEVAKRCVDSFWPLPDQRD
jgi:hypothetical protein